MPYPSSLDGLRTDVEDRQESVSGSPKAGRPKGAGHHADLHNEANDAINRLEAELGLEPSGGYDDVAARLTAITEALEALGLTKAAITEALGFTPQDAATAATLTELATEASARAGADNERVKGPALSTTGDIATFSGATGKVVQDGGKTIAEVLDRSNHTGSQTASTVSDFDTQVRKSRLDQMAKPTAAVSAGKQRLTEVAEPSGSEDAANKAWVESQTGLMVPKSLVDAKGDLLTATADNTPARLPVGTDGRVLQAASGEEKGLKWGALGNYIPVMSLGGRMSSTAASGTTYLLVPGQTDLTAPAVNTTASVAYPFLFRYTTADYAGAGSIRFRITAHLVLGSAVGKVVTLGIYAAENSAGAVKAGAVVKGSTAGVEPAKEKQTLLVTPDVDLVDGTDYVVGLTLSGTPAVSFGVVYKLEYHYV